jgi:hypothetical protein
MRFKNMSINMAIVPYIPPKTSMEFIKSEVEKSLLNVFLSQKQVIPATYTLSSLQLDFMANSVIESIKSQKKRFITDVNLDDSNPHLILSNFGGIGITLDSGNSRFDPEIPFLGFDIVKSSRISSSKQVNGDEIAETLQSEASFTIATDKKPILATYGCNPCVALGGYDETNKIAFIVHFATAAEVRKAGGLIFYNISELVKEELKKPIQIHLRGGIKGQSEETIKAIKLWMRQRSDLPMEIASEDILDSEYSFSGKSLSIDSRTGEVSDYDPLSNSKSRELSDLNVMDALMSAYNPNIKLAYTPKS